MTVTPEQIQERATREVACGKELDAVITATLEKHNCSMDLACILSGGKAPQMKINISAKSLVETGFDTADTGGQ